MLDAAVPDRTTRVLPFRESLLAMIGISLVNMLVALDQTVVSTALPSIVSDLKGFEYYAWIVTSYLLASVVTVPIFGRLGDFFGRKLFVIAAIATFTLASVLCGTAQSMQFLMWMRGFTRRWRRHDGRHCICRHSRSLPRSSLAGPVAGNYGRSLRYWHCRWSVSRRFPQR